MYPTKNFDEEPEDADEWIKLIATYITEENIVIPNKTPNVSIDYRSSKVILGAINAKFSNEQFSFMLDTFQKIDEKKDIKNKLTYVLLSDEFNEVERNEIKIEVKETGGISEFDKDHNVIHCVFDDPLTTFKFLKKQELSDFKKNLESIVMPHKTTK